MAPGVRPLRRQRPLVKRWGGEAVELEALPSSYRALSTAGCIAGVQLNLGVRNPVSPVRVQECLKLDC